jgi:hypothetical protein
LVEALCYNPEGRGFETRLGLSVVPVYLILPATLHAEVYSTANRNEYQQQKRK